MEQESCITLLLAGKSRLDCDTNDLVGIRLTPGQIKQIYLTLETFQIQYSHPKFSQNIKDLDLDDGICKTLDYHNFDVAALKLDAKNYLSYVFDEIRQQLDQGIITAEKMERSYAS